MTKRRTKSYHANGLEIMDPHEPDQKYLGDEPQWASQPEPAQRQSRLSQGFNWYNRYYDRKTARKFLVQWLTHQKRASDAKKLERVEDRELMPTLAWLARMNLMGLELTEYETIRLSQEVDRLLEHITGPVTTATTAPVSVKEKAPPTRPNIQEIMRERAAEAGGELEGMLDDYILANFPRKHNHRPIETLNRYNILPQHCETLAQHWDEQRTEFALAAVGLDDDLNEGYSHITKTQLKAAAAFCEWVAAEIRGYANVKRVNKTPRRRRAVPPEKVVARLRYMREFTLPDTKLTLKSVPAPKLVGASEIWLYDTAKRKLVYYVADPHAGTMTVKNSSLVGWEKTQSGAKTLRKPHDQLRDFMNVGKPGSRKTYADIKTVAITVSGRINENMIILKAW